MNFVTDILKKVSLPATSGSKYHYIQWAKEINGVGNAKCLPLWNGNGTVKLSSSIPKKVWQVMN